MDKQEPKEHKTEWQRTCFTLACLISLLSLIVKINDGQWIALFVIFIVFAVFFHFIFGKMD